ncbi:hypothetical protein [Pontiella sp.]|uniref:hypothetical protein n=1 Tax=Pontiella sp. TaxID=2837462 RepID=UPI0035672525
MLPLLGIDLPALAHFPQELLSALGGLLRVALPLVEPTVHAGGWVLRNLPGIAAAREALELALLRRKLPLLDLPRSLPALQVVRPLRKPLRHLTTLELRDPLCVAQVLSAHELALLALPWTFIQRLRPVMELLHALALPRGLLLLFRQRGGDGNGRRCRNGGEEYGCLGFRLHLHSSHGMLSRFG